MQTQIAIKCCVPEGIDCVTHAVIDFEIGLAVELVKRMVEARRLKADSDSGGMLMDFEALRYREFSPTWLDCSPEILGMTEKEFEALEQGFLFLSAKIQNRDWHLLDDVCSMNLCSLIVYPDQVLWEGRIKHDESGAHIETYALSLNDLQKIAEKLGYELSRLGDFRELAT